MGIVPGREPFGRPAIPIDIAAPAYHWSALKITRLIFFFAGLACDKDFLALVVDREVLFFDILHPPLPETPLAHISRGTVAVTEVWEKRHFDCSARKGQPTI